MKLKTIGAVLALAALATTAAQAQTNKVAPDAPASVTADGQHKRHAGANAEKHKKMMDMHGKRHAEHAEHARMARAPYWYGGLNIGHSDGNMAGQESAKTSYGVLLGHQFNPRFAVEGAYQDLGNRAYTTGAPGSASADAYSLSGLGFIPVSKGVRAFGKVGIAHTSSASDSDTGPVLGAGLDWSLNKRATIRTAFDVYPDFAGSDQSLTNFTVGVNYRF